jgi:uncharacterized protein YndB with AHSA1/START domain
MPDRTVWGEVEIAAPQERVFAALTDGDALTHWFAEAAGTAPANGRYEFWGRYTPDGLGMADGRVSEVVVEPLERLSYQWSLFGCRTVVRYQLHERAGATLLTVEHAGLAFERPWLLEMFWSMALENLRAFVERGEGGLRHDFSMEFHGQVQLQLEIAADPEMVFGALIDPDQLRRYMSDNPVVEPEVGGRIDFGWGDDGPYRILALEAPSQLSYAWRNSDGTPDSVVSWQLEGSAGRTRLTLVHSGFAADRDTTGYTLGWLDYLNRIRCMCEVGPGWRKPRIDLLAADESARRAELLTTTATVVG